MPSQDPDKRREKRRIQSIDVGFRLIRILEKAGAKLPLKTIAARAGMPPSKAYLYMVSFAEFGLVTQDPVTMRYGLGPYAVQLGLAGIRQLDVVDVARGPMDALQMETGLSVYLSVWGNMGPAIVLKLDGELEAPVSVCVGYVLPLLSSATGRVFLTHLPRSATDPVLKRDGRIGRDARQRTEEAVDAVRRTGVAVSDSQLHEGWAALSAPVFDHSGAIAASVTLLGMRSRLDTDPHGRMADAVRAAAQTISARLGYGAPAPVPETTPEEPPPKTRRRVSPVS